MKTAVLVTLGFSVFLFSLWIWKNIQEESITAPLEKVSREENQREVEIALPQSFTPPELSPITPPQSLPSPPPTLPLSRALSGGVKTSPPIHPPNSELPAKPPAEVNLPVTPVFVPSVESTTSPVSSATAAIASTTTAVFLPPLDEESLLAAVVKVQCPTVDGLGKYTGSGFVLKGDIVATAAHVIMDSGSKTCDVIFSRERKPIHYLRGTITEDLGKIKQRHDEEGIDVAFLKLPPLESYSEARAIFEKYPYVKHPICEDPKVLGDELLHFGYPSNFLDQNYLSKLDGKTVVGADIKGVKDQLSQDQTEVFKAPVLSYTYDDSAHHPYLISRVGIFYGDSGGLAFNKIKQCVLGPHRGATIGRSPGENFSLFMNLGWQQLRELLSTAEAFVID